MNLRLAKKSAEHRKSERMHVSMVRYHLKHANYVEAFRSLAWALQQSTAADQSEREEERAVERARETKRESKIRIRGVR